MALTMWELAMATWLGAYAKNVMGFGMAMYFVIALAIFSFLHFVRVVTADE